MTKVGIQSFRDGLRSHQRDALDIANRVVTGALAQDKFVVSATPGSGKTLLASVFAQVLIAGDMVDYVCIACPRESLTVQMRDGFTRPDLGLPLGIGVAKNDKIGSRSLFSNQRAGYVTTYQSIHAKPKAHARIVSRKDERWLLILDESHHLNEAEEPGWTRAVSPLVEHARFVLLMSGSMVGKDGCRLAFVDYDDKKQPKVDIRYSRRKALDERAILPVSVKLCDGDARYWHKYSQHEVKLSRASKKEEPKALATLVGDSSYRNDVLSEAIREWEQFRATTYKSRMIVICVSQDAARDVAHYIRESTKWTPALAVSQDGESSRKALASFRDKGVGDILVTCMMAYEGLDVPDCTHLVALTNIRERRWLEQAFARATRVDAKCSVPYEQQVAFLYVPNDPEMVEFLNEALEEQDERYRDREQTGATGRPRGSTFSPIDGELSTFRYGDTYGVFSEADNRRLVRFDGDYPAFASHPSREKLKLARDLWPNDAEFASNGKSSHHGSATP